MKKQEYTIPVYSTNDYTIFEKLKGNRDLYKNHVKKLVQTVERKPDFTKMNPIRVNEKMEVIDGQHRLAAFEEYASGKGESPDLFYIIDKGATLDSARNLNIGSKAWLPMDYASAYAEEGNKNYITYVKYAKKYKTVNHEILQEVLSGEVWAPRTAAFRLGHFVVKKIEQADEVLNNLIDCSQYYHNWPNQAFGKALLGVMRSEKYDHARMIEQLEKYKEALYNVPQRKMELRTGLNMVFNWKRADKVDLLKD